MTKIFLGFRARLRYQVSRLGKFEKAAILILATTCENERRQFGAYPLKKSGWAKAL
ncbi:MAG: hypothetical protein ACE5FU_04835 [Nitrospinota bacterium]